jgi:hypothetical protein
MEREHAFTCCRVLILDEPLSGAGRTYRAPHRREALRDTQAVCGFRYLASKLTHLFPTINTIVAIFLAKVRRAISGLIPLASKAA